MKAIEIKAPGQMLMTEKPPPEAMGDFVRVAVKAAAICATDLEVIDGRIPARYPLVPGHEWSGVVEAVGSPEYERWLGKRVIGSNDVVCLKCPACRSGEWRYCESFEEIGFKRDGAYAEAIAVPGYGLLELPDSVPFEIGALMEPLGVALGTLEKANVRMGQTLLILGAGSIGLCMLAAARAMGLRRIVVAARGRGRLDIARSMGAAATVATGEEELEERMKTLHPGGTDLVIEATGIEECVQSALRVAKKGGTVALAGYGRGKLMSIRMDDIHIKNLRVVGAGNNWNQLDKGLQLVEEGLVDLKPLVTHRLRLEDWEEGLRLARERPQGFVKAVFEL